MDGVKVILRYPGDQHGQEGGEKVGTAVWSPVYGSLGNIPYVEGLEICDQTQAE